MLDKETVAAYLTPTAGTAKIFASQQGTIKAVYVHEGDEIKKGQPLLAVDTSHIAANGQDVNSKYAWHIGAEQTSLENRITANALFLEAIAIVS